MIITKTVEVNVTSRNKTHLKERGYDVSKDTLEINVSDLNRYSRNEITVKCSICENISVIKYNKYMDNIERYGFYTCRKCSTIKKKMTFETNYGVDNPMKCESIKDKSKKTKKEKYGDENYNNMEQHKKTCYDKFGTDYALQNKDVRNKIKKTNIEKYGFDHPNKSDIIKNKIKKKRDKTILKNSIDLYKNKHNINIIEKNDHNYKIKCDLCNKPFIINMTLLQLRILYKNVICTHCNPIGINNTSQFEKKITNFIKKYYKDKIILNSKKIIKPYELDIYLPDLNLAFEFNGLYWHNELNKSKDYHKNKSDLCDKKNIQLIHIYEDDWIYKEHIIKSMILNKLNLSENKIYARKCTIKEIDNNTLINSFLNNNHIQGTTPSSIKIGLFYENELISLMTFGKFRKSLNLKSRDGCYELIRFCNILNTNVVGGASKLFKYFIKNYNPKQIISYADRSYSNGYLYKKLNFELKHITPPNYYYIVNGIKKHRFNYRKKKLIEQGFDTNKTEHEIMLERKIYRIYNSGNLKFIYENK